MLSGKFAIWRKFGEFHNLRLEFGGRVRRASLEGKNSEVKSLEGEFGGRARRASSEGEFGGQEIGGQEIGGQEIGGQEIGGQELGGQAQLGGQEPLLCKIIETSGRPNQLGGQQHWLGG